MCELTLKGLSVHYIVDCSVPCQLGCLVAFGIYDIFPNFPTLLLVLVREMKRKKFFLLGIIFDLSRRKMLVQFGEELRERCLKSLGLLSGLVLVVHERRMILVLSAFLSWY